MGELTAGIVACLINSFVYFLKHICYFFWITREYLHDTSYSLVLSICFLQTLQFLRYWQNSTQKFSKWILYISSNHEDSYLFISSWYMSVRVCLCLLFSHSVVSDSLWPHGLQYTRLPLFFTISWSLLKFMSTELVMPFNHLVLFLWVVQYVLISIL